MKKVLTVLLLPKYIGRHRPDTIFGAKFYFIFMVVLHFFSHFIRVYMASRLFGRTGAISREIRENGYAIKSDPDPGTNALVERCLKLIPDRNLDFYKVFDIENVDDKHIFDFAMSDTILAPVSQYLGYIPVVRFAALWHDAPYALKRNPGRAQVHMDIEDHRIVRVFIYLNDFDKEGGPLNIIARKNTKYIYHNLKKVISSYHRNTIVNKELFKQNITDIDFTKILTKRSDICFADTCSCYHFGGLTEQKSRSVLVIQYTSPYVFDFAVYGRNVKNLKYSQNIQDRQRSSLARKLFGISHCGYHYGGYFGGQKPSSSPESTKNLN